jgi:hypothetical protein
MIRWRRSAGTLLILTPLLALVLVAIAAVLMGAIGMGVRWNSRGDFFATTSCIVLVLGACVATGIKLRKSSGAQ